jgi:hypothetical protein
MAKNILLILVLISLSSFTFAADKPVVKKNVRKTASVSLAPDLAVSMLGQLKQGEFKAGMHQGWQHYTAMIDCSYQNGTEAEGLSCSLESLPQ